MLHCVLDAIKTQNLIVAKFEFKAIVHNHCQQVTTFFFLWLCATLHHYIAYSSPIFALIFQFLLYGSYNLAPIHGLVLLKKGSLLVAHIYQSAFRFDGILYN